MKKMKISKILGVGLALVMVFSLMVGFMPAQKAEAQAWTPNQWGTLSIPTATGAVRLAADCNLIALGPDGMTFYAASNQAGATALYRSVNGGKSWTAFTNLPAAPAASAVTFPITELAVAPDDPNIVAFVDSNFVTSTAGNIYLSTNGGAIWSPMVNVGTVTGFVAASVIQDLDISEATAGGREYMVCTANPVGAIDNGNVFIFGTAAAPLAWTEIGAAAGGDPIDNAGLEGMDFTACAFTPGYAGTKVILVIGSTDNIDTAPAGLWPAAQQNDTLLNIKNTSFPGWDAAPAQGFTGWPVDIEVAAGDSPSEALIVASGIALPSDFDPTIADGRRVYVYWDSNSATATDDAYRVDNDICRELNVAAGAAIRLTSIAYGGVREAGTLFVGDLAGAYAGSQVRRCADPWATLPTWKTSPKPPTGGSAAAPGTASVQVALPADFMASNIVYAGTRGTAIDDQSAFSISRDGGVSFNGLSLIDTCSGTAFDAILDVAPSADGKNLFMATADTAAARPESLWKSTSSPLGGSWERVLAVNFNDTGIIRLDPDYATTSVLYFAETFIGGNRAIRYSTNGGQTYSNRFFPADITDFAVQSKDVIYALIGTTTRKTTNAAWGWGLPKNTGLTAPATVMVAPNGDVFVGGTGNVAYSTDAGETYGRMTAGIGAGAGLLQVAVDKAYDTNKTVYAASSTATEGIYRWTLGTSTAWEQIRTVAGSMTGLVQWDGILYGSWINVGTTGSVHVAGDTFRINSAPALLADNGTITCTTGRVRITVVSSVVGNVTVNGAAAAVTLTPGGSATWAIIIGSAILTNYIEVEALTANTNGTWTSVVGTSVAWVSVDTAPVDAWVVPGPGIAAYGYSLPTAEIPVVGVTAGVGSGAERTLGPLDQVADIAWQTLDVGAAAATFNRPPSALKVSGGGGNWLFAINNIAAPTLMAYDDSMAGAAITMTCPAKVPADPGTGRNNSFVMKWTQVSNANQYHVFIWSSATMPDLVYAAPNSPGAPAAYNPLVAAVPSWEVPANILASGRDYWVSARAVNQATGDGNRSPWSARAKFSVEYTAPVEAPYAGPVLLGPAPGATGVSLKPGFAWGPVSGAIKYEFELSTNPGVTAGGYFVDALVGLTGTNALVTTAWQCDKDLGYATNYYYHVKAFTASGETGWTTGTFSTITAGVFTCPLDGLTFATQAELQAHNAVAHAPVIPQTPAYIWAVVIIGAILVIVVIALIFTTRRVP
jgi:hypothetical protein